MASNKQTEPDQKRKQNTTSPMCGMPHWNDPTVGSRRRSIARSRGLKLLYGSEPPMTGVLPLSRVVDRAEEEDDNARTRSTAWQSNGSSSERRASASRYLSRTSYARRTLSAPPTPRRRHVLRSTDLSLAVRPPRLIERAKRTAPATISVEWRASRARKRRRRGTRRVHLSERVCERGLQLSYQETR